MQILSALLLNIIPFHCGHVWQLRELRRRYPDIDGIIVAMSGSFTQRGTPCIMDKWRRARHAVAAGLISGT